MSRPDPTNYTPIYVDVEDIPVAGEDQYRYEEKVRALFQAEARFEMDVNGGREIPGADLSRLHVAAVLALGTYNLVRGARSPSEPTLGDLEDDGNDREDYAERFLEDYNSLVDTLANNDDGGGVYYGATNTSRAGNTAVNTRNPLEMEKYYPFRREDRFPDTHEDY